MTKRLNVIFMGTPDFAVRPLQALIDSAHNVIAVYSQPPRPSGRGRMVQESPVHYLANQHGIQVFTPENFRGEDDRNIFAALHADVAVVAAYGLILPGVILEAPKHGCLNIHASLLPRWRGASPIQHAIWRGDKETGVTVMQMEKGLDTGPMIAKATTNITDLTSSQNLHNELSRMGAGLITKVLNQLAVDGSLQAQAQDDAQSTYAPLLTREHGRIDWTKSAVEIDAQIRALNPWPGTWCMSGDRKMKVLLAHKSDQKNFKPAGKVLSRGGHIACGDGDVIQVMSIQPEGGAKAMDFSSAINGGYVSMDGFLS